MIASCFRLLRCTPRFPWHNPQIMQAALGDEWELSTNWVEPFQTGKPLRSVSTAISVLVSSSTKVYMHQQLVTWLVCHARPPLCLMAKPFAGCCGQCLPNNVRTYSHWPVSTESPACHVFVRGLLWCFFKKFKKNVFDICKLLKKMSDCNG